MTFELTVNGQRHRVDADPWSSLLFVLREHLGLYASKNACEQGECGSCSVLVDGDLVCSCLVMASQAVGQQVTTLEGLAGDPMTERIQDCLLGAGGVQCGFCTPGFVVAIRDLLERKPGESVSDEQIEEHLSGNLCRCTGYTRIIDAVRTLRDGEAGAA